MKIAPVENQVPVASLQGERKTNGLAAPASAGSAPAAAPSAQVALSPEATVLASGEGSFDAGKVERVGRAIKDGSYQVNAEAIADKLIANAQELLGRTAR